QITPETLVASNTFVVVQQISAAVKDRPISVKLDPLGMMGRMTVNPIHGTGVDPFARKSALLLRYGVAPVVPPVYRSDHYVPRPLEAIHRLCCSASRAPRQVAQQVDTRPILARGPSEGNATRLGSEREHENAPLPLRSEE